jgi:hypothetical protein
MPLANFVVPSGASVHAPAVEVFERMKTLCGALSSGLKAAELCRIE